MSCRVARTDTLPRWNPEFHLEHNPPSLPARSAPSKCVWGLAVVLASIGGITVLGSAAGPLVDASRVFASGVQNSLGSVLDRAHENARLHAEQQQQRRDAFAQRRSRQLEETEPEPRPRRRKSSLLLKMAAIRGEGAGDLNEVAIQTYFPQWLLDKKSEFNQKEVLKDVMLAVAQLSHETALDREL